MQKNRGETNPSLPLPTLPAIGYSESNVRVTNGHVSHPNSPTSHKRSGGEVQTNFSRQFFGEKGIVGPGIQKGHSESAVGGTNQRDPNNGPGADPTAPERGDGHAGRIKMVGKPQGHYKRATSAGGT